MRCFVWRGLFCIWVHTSPSHPVAGACATLSGPACSRSAFEKSAREYIFRGNELNELCVKRRAVKGAAESCTTLSCLTTVLGHYSLENPGNSVDLLYMPSSSSGRITIIFAQLQCERRNCSEIRMAASVPLNTPPTERRMLLRYNFGLRRQATGAKSACE